MSDTGPSLGQTLWLSGEQQGWGQPLVRLGDTGIGRVTRGKEGLAVLGRWSSGARTQYDPDPREQPAGTGHTSRA